MGLESATVFPELVTTNPTADDARSEGDDHLRLLKVVLNNLGKLHKGPTQPATRTAGMLWLEDDNPSATVWTLHMWDGAAWIALLQIDSTNDKILFISPVLLTGLGTVGAPALSFNGDPNTGIFSPGADILALVQGGVEFLRGSATEVVVAEGADDRDFRVEGLALANLLRTDFGLAGIGFGMSPTAGRVQSGLNVELVGPEVGIYSKRATNGALGAGAKLTCIPHADITTNPAYFLVMAGLSSDVSSSLKGAVVWKRTSTAYHTVEIGTSTALTIGADSTDGIWVSNDTGGARVTQIQALRFGL